MEQRAETDSPPGISSGRAKPLPVEERRAAIAEAILPLLRQHGRDVTTRQIAEAAGVAEGTLFRVFDDKEAIIAAAVETFLDPEPFREQLRRIDPSLPLELKLELVLGRFRDRFTGIFGVFAALGGHRRPPEPPNADIVVGIFEHLLAPDLEALRIPPDRVFAYVRLLAFASAMPHLSAIVGFDDDELAHLVVHGILREPSGPVASGPEASGPALSGPGASGPGASIPETSRVDIRSSERGTAPCF